MEFKNQSHIDILVVAGKLGLFKTTELSSASIRKIDHYTRLRWSPFLDLNLGSDERKND
jgi:hypothetical protein